MADQPREGELPTFVRVLFPPVAIAPAGLLLTHCVRTLARRQPNLFDRLGEWRSARYLVAPSDLAFAFIVVPDGEKSIVHVVGKNSPGSVDVAITGPLLTLLGLLDGTLDGDALFFHRIISISGRTEAILALRNTIEDAELRPADFFGLHGIVARLADAGILNGLSVVRWLIAGRAHATGKL
ncbi:lipid carrier [Pseudaminobacter arsenicus]|uniref:Lipid carrier n=1 Tax=Borborobacter arsenicus TaxID=1851146 RepID=A0A432UZ15_9HYPH|nr:SCP2 sterol-binding domain-containing protein [Pseudaminobacter arsenicus]RUM95177.1 lipid carrier [Pseudaminobacter arsenicus]